MCDECHFFTCPSGCPNAPEPPVFDYCEACGVEIYEGDEYYEIDAHCYCEACVQGGYKVAGED